jgi:hypothetical protein
MRRRQIFEIRQHEAELERREVINYANGQIQEEADAGKAWKKEVMIDPHGHKTCVKCGKTLWAWRPSARPSV